MFNYMYLYHLRKISLHYLTRMRLIDVQARPCDKCIGNEGDWNGATPIHCYSKDKDNGWPNSPTAERKTRPFSNVLGARRRQKKEGETEEGMAKYIKAKM